jgi:hypothetical protein
MTDGGRIQDILDKFSHDARGALGTIRFAITGIRDNPDNAAMRDELLAAADAEAQRLVGEIVALERRIRDELGGGA